MSDPSNNHYTQKTKNQNTNQNYDNLYSQGVNNQPAISNRSSSAQTSYRNENTKEETFKQIVIQTVNPQKVKLQNSPKKKVVSAHSMNLRYLLPPKKTSKKTLVLDLDETLIHSNFEEFPKGSDIKINVKIENILYKIFAMKRPGVEEFLERMGKLFELVIYTASLQQVSKYK